MKSLSRVQLFATTWTVAYQAPPSMGFSRQEYWSGLPFPSPGDLPDPGIEPRSPAFQADALTSEPLSHLCPTLCNPMAIARQTPPSMGFSRQEYWSGVPCTSPGYLPNSGTEPTTLASPALAGRFFPTVPPGKSHNSWISQRA